MNAASNLLLDAVLFPLVLSYPGFAYYLAPAFKDIYAIDV